MLIETVSLGEEYREILSKRMRGFCKNSPLRLDFVLYSDYLLTLIQDPQGGGLVVLPSRIDPLLSIEDMIHSVHVQLRGLYYPILTLGGEDYRVDKVGLSRNEFVLYRSPGYYFVYRYTEESGVTVSDWLERFRRLYNPIAEMVFVQQNATLIREFTMGVEGNE